MDETQQPQPQQPPDWIQKILDQVGQYQLTDQDIDAIGQFLLTSGIEDQIAQRQYQSDYLDYLNRQLGLNQQQLAQAEQEMAFQQGPYWEFYTGPFFDLQKQKTANDLAMSNNEVKRSANFLDQARFQTQQAKYSAEAAKNNFYATLGFFPKSESLDPRSRFNGY